MSVLRQNNAIRTLLFAAFLISMNRSQTVNAQINVIENMIFASGKCVRFTIRDENYSCTSVIYMHFKNGRTAWNVPLPHGAVMLSGGRDSQIDPTRYILSVDTIRAGRGNGSSDSYKATGECVARLSPDGDYLHSLNCDVGNGIEAIKLDFRGDGRKVEKKFF